MAWFLEASEDGDALTRWRSVHAFRAGRLDFYENYLDSGEDFRVFLEFVIEQMDNRKAIAAVAARQVLQTLQEGKPVAEALSRVMPPTDITMLASWESRGMLNEGMAELIDAVRQETELRSAAVSQLAAPLFYVAMALGLMTYGIPLMVSSMGGALLNPATMTLDQRALVLFSGFMSRNAGVLGALYVVLPLLFVWSLPRWQGRLRRWLDVKFPPYGMYRSYHAALFLRTLGSQLVVTPKLEDAVAAIHQTSNRWLQGYLELILERIPEFRTSPAMALDVGLLDVQTVDALALVSRRGESEKAISGRAKKATRAALKTIHGYVMAIGAGGKVLLGVILAWAVLSLMTQTIRQQVQGGGLGGPPAIQAQSPAR